MRKAFAEHPGEYGVARFSKVQLWGDFAGRHGPDNGIDLVARDHDGNLVAIQCKFHNDRRKLSQGVDTFLAESNTGEFAGRIFVSTADLTDNAHRKLTRAQPSVEILTPAELERWPVEDWRAHVQQPESLEFQDVRYEPRPYQNDAVDDVVSGFANHNRGRLILPCGTGKSVVALWIAERMVGKGGRVLYLVPSIALMGQTMREWAAQRDPDLKPRYLGVCSDRTAGRAGEDADISELAMPVTTDPERIAGELGQEWPEALHVTFCTYQSLVQILKAQQAGAPDFDLVVCDEAHRTTGIEETTTRQKTARKSHRQVKPRTVHPSTRQQQDQVVQTPLHDRYASSVHRAGPTPDRKQSDGAVPRV